jgi:hypothetical protein
MAEHSYAFLGGAASGGSSGGGGVQTVLQPSDLTYEGALRLQVVLGDGGTGNLSLVGGAPCFRTRPDGKISVFFLGDYYGGYPTGHPLVEFEIDPTVPANPTMGSAPYMTYLRTWGDIRDGHILVASGGQSNFYAGGCCLEPVNSTTSYLWWATNDGYTIAADYPELSCTVLHHDTITWESYGPWRIDKHSTGHRRFCTGQMLQLPPAFVAAHCPGYGKGVMGQTGSSAGQSPFGPSLLVFEDFNPTTKPPATGVNQAPNVASKTLIAHDGDHKKARDTRYKTCGWTVPYNCTLGSNILPGTSDWGGSDPAVLMDNCAWLTWVDLPTRRGVIYGGQLVRTPSGYTAPGDPDGYVHQWYGSATHGTSSGSGYADQACCHGQPSPWWGSTGPASHFLQPMGWIYDPLDLGGVIDVGGATSPYALTPTTDAFEWKAICSGCNITPPTAVTDWAGVFDWWGAGWLDPTTHKLYVGAKYDRTTGYILPCLYVFQLP